MSVMKLLPCAHCGSPAEEVSDVRYGWYVVACTNEDCGITMSEVGIESQAEANAIWNRRAEIAPEAAVVFNKTLTGCEIKLIGGGGGGGGDT